MVRFKLMIVAAGVTAGCAAGGGPSSPSPDRALAYTVPSMNPLAYEITDSTAISMDVMGMPVQLTGNSFAALQLEFAQAGPRLRTVVRFTDLRGEFMNSMGPSLTLTSGDMPRPATVSVGARGDVHVTELPSMTETAAQLLGSNGAYLRLFVRLPARAVMPGAQWVDTVQVNDEASGMATSTTNIVTSVLGADTTVGGRRLHVIRSESRSTARVAGSNQGVELRQSLTGTGQAVTLWDPALGAVAERVETTTMTGSMELPAMGMSGIPVQYRNRLVLRIVR